MGGRTDPTDGAPDGEAAHPSELEGLMGLFGKDDTTLAMKVGELIAKVDALEIALATLRAERQALPAPVVTSAIPTKVALAIKGLAGKDAALARHLTEEAAGLIGFAQMDEDRVVEVLLSGSRH